MRELGWVVPLVLSDAKATSGPARVCILGSVALLVFLQEGEVGEDGGLHGTSRYELPP